MSSPSFILTFVRMCYVSWMYFEWQLESFWSSRVFESNLREILFNYLRQCRNWDGGLQEFETAKSCVEAVFPGAEIISNRVDQYPIKVTVTANVEGSKQVVWSGRQQDLFRKYASKRNKAMNEIKTNLMVLK